MRGAVTRRMARLLMWLPMLAGGVMGVFAIARSRPVQAWWHRSRLAQGIARERFGPLRHSILGKSKRAVAAVLGPPRTAMVMQGAGGGAADFWQADTWYYPLLRRDRAAMAIVFADEVAAEVEFVPVPERGSGA